MTNKSTKKALALSVISLVVCVSMLVGTTFAWFTDSVTSTNNIIKSGNLDVKLYYQNDEVTAWTEVDEETNVFKTNTLWEPGHTEVVKFKVVNAGSLALKYSFGVNVASEITSVSVLGNVLRLSDYIYFGVVDGEDNYDRAGAIAAVKDSAVAIKDGYSAKGELLAAAANAESADIVTMVVYMPETVGNEANYAADAAVPTINLGVNLLATQLASEKDSFDEKYDESAVHYDSLASASTDLEAAIRAGDKTIAIDGTVTLTNSLGAHGVKFVGMNDAATIDFGVYGISGTGNTFENLILDNDRKGWYEGMQYSDGEDTTYINCTFANGITTYGNSTFKGCTFNELPAGNYALFVYDGVKHVVEDCIFNYGDRAIKIYNEGGTKNIEMTVSDTDFKASDSTTPNKAMIEIDDKFMDSIKVTVNDITIDSAIAAMGVYRINDGVLDTSTEKSKVTVNGVLTYVADGLCTDDAGNFYIYSANGLTNFRGTIGTWGSDALANKSINIMADIDATGKTWETAVIASGSASRNGFTFNGNGHTISNLTIVKHQDNATPGTGLFAMNSGNSNPTTFKNITFDNVTVNGGHHTGILWGQMYGKIVVDGVNVVNSNVTGTCNVGALIGRNGDDSASEITFKNCSVKNTKVEAIGTTSTDDKAGASAFLGMALTVAVNGVGVKLDFEGTNVSEGNTLISANGYNGGGIYTTSAWDTESWNAPVIVKDFNDYNSNN